MISLKAISVIFEEENSIKMKKYAYSVLLVGLTLWYCNTMRSEIVLISSINSNLLEFNIDSYQINMMKKPTKTINLIKKLKK